MADNPRGLDDPNPESNGPATANRVHDLTWALFDELVTADELGELQGLLLNDSVAREAYIRCAQLHADLTTHFAMEAKSQGASKSKTPILSFLNEGLPKFGAPSTEDTVQ
jgi:hypothetical protein